MKRILSLFGPKQAPIHSHAMTRVASPQTIGSTSAQSFTQRMAIDKNRQRVGSYRYASIHQSEAGERIVSERSSQALTSSQQPIDIVKPGSVRMREHLATQRPVFREPGGHKHDPYA